MVDFQTVEESLLGRRGYNFTVTKDERGKGYFGTVYVGTDENGSLVAVKRIPVIDEQGVPLPGGLPNLMEASIMCSIIHPALNRARAVVASDKYLYLIQDLADADLGHVVRRTDYKTDINHIRRWCWSLAQAVACLHVNEIIHADVKAHNILLFADGTTKLTDFTLGMQRWGTQTNFTHTVCTSTHRPPENFLGLPWNESLDMWSVGCTIYELVYGANLFLPQRGQGKEAARAAAMNSIMDWANYQLHRTDTIAQSNVNGSNPPILLRDKVLTRSNVEYKPPILHPDWHKDEYMAVNDIILRLLTINPEERLTSAQLLLHPFFSTFSPHSFVLVRMPEVINESEMVRVCQLLVSLESDGPYAALISKLAATLYKRCPKIGHSTEPDRVAAALWVAQKLVLGKPPVLQHPPPNLFQLERDLCHGLGFRLHTS